MATGQEGPSAGDRVACPKCGELMFAAETTCWACGHRIIHQAPPPSAPMVPGQPRPPGAPRAPGQPAPPQALPGRPGGRDLATLQAEIAGATKLVKILCLLFGILLVLGAIGLVVVLLLTPNAPPDYYGRGYVIVAVVMAAGIALVIYGSRRREWVDGA